MIHPRVQLVSAEVVATMRGVSRDHIYAQADGGEETFLWVFNVGTTPRIRELRWWRNELLEPASTRFMTLDEVIRQIVPRRELPGQYCGLPKWQVCELLRVSRATLAELAAELPAVPHAGGMYISRNHLETFFRNRWCFASTTKHSLA